MLEFHNKCPLVRWLILMLEILPYFYDFVVINFILGWLLNKISYKIFNSGDKKVIVLSFSHAWIAETKKPRIYRGFLFTYAKNLSVYRYRVLISLSAILFLILNPEGVFLPSMLPMRGCNLLSSHLRYTVFPLPEIVYV